MLSILQRWMSIIYIKCMERNKEFDIESLNKEKPKNKVTEISYYRPKFWKRCFAILFDSIICFLVSLSLFLGVKEIVDNVPYSKEINNNLNALKLESDIYIYSNNLERITDIVSYYNQSTSVSMGAMEIDLVNRIDNFFVFLEEKEGSKISSQAINNYNEAKLSTNLVYNNKSYFILIDNVVIKNEEANIPSEMYVENFYKPYIDEVLQGYFSSIDEVLTYTRYQSNMLFFLEIPLGLFLGYGLVFYVVPLCFRRGKQTLGRFIFKIGLVDKNILSVKTGLFTIRFLILFFVEVLLSIFTFAIPLFISFSMMAFSKKKQTFHDFMLGIEEVDVEVDKIFFSKSEIFGKKETISYKDFNSK